MYTFFGFNNSHRIKTLFRKISKLCCVISGELQYFLIWIKKIQNYNESAKNILFFGTRDHYKCHYKSICD